MTDLGECIGDERLITREDAVARQRAGDLDDELVSIVVEHGMHVGEGGVPDGLGELRTEQLGDGSPHLLLITHSNLRGNSCSLPHRCSTPLSTGVDNHDGARAGAAT